MSEITIAHRGIPYSIYRQQGYKSGRGAYDIIDAEAVFLVTGSVSLVNDNRMKGLVL